MKLLYKPFGIIFGVLGGLVGGAIFKQVWKLVAGEDDAPAGQGERVQRGPRFCPRPHSQGPSSRWSRPRSTAAARRGSRS